MKSNRNMFLFIVESTSSNKMMETNDKKPAEKKKNKKKKKKNLVLIVSDCVINTSMKILTVSLDDIASYDSMKTKEKETDLRSLFINE